MTDLDVLKWIKRNLVEYILPAIQGTIYSEELLAGITCRETGILIKEWAPKTKDVMALCSIMRGDLSRRIHDAQAIYHGYGLTQIDINSFPSFVKSGDWKDPKKVYPMTVKVLEGKKDYILGEFPMLWGDDLIEYVTAAYNCGEGNEVKILSNGLDPDAYTTGHNYAEAVLRFAETYKNLI